MNYMYVCMDGTSVCWVERVGGELDLVKCTHVYSDEVNPSLRSRHGAGGEEGVLLFCEESPILALALDPLDSQQSLWVATTSTHINKWVRHGRGYKFVLDNTH